MKRHTASQLMNLLQGDQAVMEESNARCSLSEVLVVKFTQFVVVVVVFILTERLHDP